MERASQQPYVGVWTLANALSLARLPLAVAVWVVADRPFLLLAVIALAGLTDVLDGWVARRYQPSCPEAAVGSWLDPLCDKIFVLSLLGALWLQYALDAWLVVLICTREIVQLPVFVLYAAVPRLHHLHIDFRAAMLGKLTTVAQFAAVIAVLFAPEALLEVAVVTAVMGFAAGATYVHRGVRYLREQLL